MNFDCLRTQAVALDARRVRSNTRIFSLDDEPVPLRVNEYEFKATLSTFGKDRDGDEIVPGAFDDFVARANATQQVIPMLREHDPRAIGGEFRDFTISDKGLHATGRLANTRLGQELRSGINAGKLACSLGFVAIEPDGAEPLASGRTRYVAIDARECSLCKDPIAYGTSIDQLVIDRDNALSAMRSKYPINAKGEPDIDRFTDAQSDTFMADYGNIRTLTQRIEKVRKAMAG